MHVEVIEEGGFRSALLGISLSYNSEPSERVASRLAWKGGGESKFLESMQVWLDITAPRYWWSQFDTYRVGTTKQSESTMHTLMRRHLVSEDFEGGLSLEILSILNDGIDAKEFQMVKRFLPEAFLQRRIVCTNYKTIQNMFIQRKNHKLPEWHTFLLSLETQLDHPEYVCSV